MFKKIRIGVLLFILLLVGARTFLTHARLIDWDQPLSVVIYPVNADASPATADHIAGLSRDDYKPIERFMREQGERYSLTLDDPVQLEMGPEVTVLPPAPPFGQNIIAIMWWSLKLRYWAWKNDTYQGPLADIRVFVLYYDPENYSRLDHSVGMKEGHLCLVKAFASWRQTARNNVIIVHEILHTLGATDKYDLQSLQPLYPGGYADPEQQPLLPQYYGEIMGRAIPVSASESRTPDSLTFVQIGPQTAREIHWLE